jgi:hypothetical protein
MMPSGRRFTVFFTWDKPFEAAKPLGQLEERFPALFELRRLAWPGLEAMRTGPQGIAGFLDRIVLGDFRHFADVVAEETGQAPVLVSARESDGTRHALRDLLAAGPDTVIVVSLDHMDSAQVPDEQDLAAARAFLARPDTVLAVCPHHLVGLDTPADEHWHHGDPNVPATQQLGGYARALLAGLGLPVENRYGLSPATGADGTPAALKIAGDLDEQRFLGGGTALPVTTFNAHPHLPHLQPVGAAATRYRVLARQAINRHAPAHPFTAGGNWAFNALLWAPPHDARKGHVLVCDATLWSAAFKGLDSLGNFWRNLARMPVARAG